MPYEYQAGCITRKPCKRTRLESKKLLEISDGFKPKTLHHYTTLDTLRKIVESKSIWGSKLSDLNDPEERRHGQDLVACYIYDREKVSEGYEQEFLNACLREVCVGEKWSQDYETAYSISLSEDSRSERMFDEYGDNGYGVSIGFDTCELVRCSTESLQTNVELSIDPIRMVYSSYDQVCLIDRCVSLACQNLPPFLGHTCKREGILSDITHLTDNVLFVAATRFKDEKWSYENEWRIGPWPWHDKTDLAGMLRENVIIIKNGEDEIRPRLKISLCFAENSSLGIDTIVLGQNAVKSARKRKLRRYFPRENARR